MCGDGAPFVFVELKMFLEELLGGHVDLVRMHGSMSMSL